MNRFDIRKTSAALVGEKPLGIAWRMDAGETRLGATVDGDGGDNVLVGTGSSDVISGLDGNDTLFGLGGDDTLNGGTANDILDGGTGGDVMAGGTGDDWYDADSLSDIVVENGGEGNDRVLALADYRLTPGAEVELIAALDAAGTSALNLAGNETDNIIFGNEGANLLEGEGGDDHLVGRGGDDRLMGGEGRDYLEGRAGADELDGGPDADVMAGGVGDDIYHMDHDSDGLIETVGGGHDVAMLAFGAFARFTLAPGAEIEEVIASATMRGISGNDFGQVLRGNDTFNELWGAGGDDQLFGFGDDDWMWGGPGADLMDGGTGNDWYEIDDAGDTIVEAIGNGFDRATVSIDYQLPPGVELELISPGYVPGTPTPLSDPLNFTGNELGQIIEGTSGTNRLLGLGGNDVLIGGSGGDILDGGDGHDWLWGDGLPLPSLNPTPTMPASLNPTFFEPMGPDIYRFTTALGPDNVDHIGAFQAGAEQIELDDAVFVGLAPGALAADAFRVGMSALDADDRIIFDRRASLGNYDRGTLVFDADGSGPIEGVPFATILIYSDKELSHSDFTVI